MKIDHVAVQLYTLRDLTAQDMPGTLRRLAEIGYRAVEFAGYGNATPQNIRAVLDELGMRGIAAHVRLQQLEQNTDQIAQELHHLGCEYIVVPWIGEEYRQSVDQVRRLAEQLNRMGRQMAEQGLRLAYHNHQFEFAPLDGTTMWDLLIAETDPALVDFELDIYWAAYAEHDPIALIEQHNARLTLLHLKDRATDGSDAPVGDGSLPWERILATARARWYIVEQDHPREPLDDVARSLHSLRGLAQVS
jgi:sugar phosphate isomerase/epimerase